jgi:sulfide dehydrogenase cytochrome subunit
MRSQTTRSRAALSVALTPLALAAALSSCQDLPTGAPDVPDNVPAKPTLAVVATVNLAGRALAANCFQCHGTNGVAGELKIAGESASEIMSELNEMRGKNPRDNIMNLHALAYTPAEMALIADYISRQGN